MVAVLQSTFAIIFSMEFIVGTLGNGFIILMTCIDWVRRRKISLVDQILTALAITRITLILLVFIDWWVSVLFPALHETGKILRMYFISWTVINHCNLWLTASLSIIYFLKIASFSSIIFLYLKFRVKNVVFVTLLVSLFFLFINTAIVNVYFDVCFDGVQRNVSQVSRLYNHEQICKFLSFTNPMFAFIPFVTSMATFFLLIFSLWRHLKNMKHNAEGCRDVSTIVHIRALQTIIVSVVLYSTFFLSFFVKVWSSGSPERYLIFLFVWALGNAVLPAHTFVLIWGNCRLRWASLSLMLWLRYRFKNIDV
ncbi:taste receptor type 2 member 113 [Rattus norvegicus]|uniref:Taste receptor type 2 member 113 n=1 Tax=Rattus norvegicus TaxID=10116 RepID=TR113_RAT|nr:taste receptor type 2 member 113 [Rattus norvegicus]Q67ES1.1 RecName: Full=Taste receptor type 2 member 113; Short=T2R113; AltName: Full=Taste receptor type 2 member 30; Short=T2R30 [Rattus norvegicus]AAR13358.1 putative taste receptor T2R30 [Rattus norvegicus]|eukprot:NP_001160161.1 taste receptor type 2 member 113 [Rattus norvegicus]